MRERKRWKFRITSFCKFLENFFFWNSLMKLILNYHVEINEPIKTLFFNFSLVFFRKRVWYIEGIQSWIGSISFLFLAFEIPDLFFFLSSSYPSRSFFFFFYECDARGWLECEFNCKSVRSGQWKVEDRGWLRCGGRFRFGWILNPLEDSIHK